MPPMAWGALSLAIASFLCIGLGVLFTPVPGLGAVFSFGAPVLALVGIILGGRAVSRSKAVPAAAGGAPVPAPAESSGLALAAVIASALAFVPAVITALTCGACNALCAAGEVSTRHSFKTGVDPFDVLLGPGVRGPDLAPGDAGAADPAAAVDGGAPASGPQPVLPPPPLAPGPSR
jgi:hypothetical protein